MSTQSTGAVNTDEIEPLDFDEAYYLATNPDVASALGTSGAGRWRSGLEHYLAHGRSEGRAPRRPLAAAQLTEEVPARGAGARTPASYLNSSGTMGLHS